MHELNQGLLHYRWILYQLSYEESIVYFIYIHTYLEKEMATHSSVLPGESQGQGSLVVCRLWGRTESDTTEAT